jgi:malyl-CoA/(S)-citramalyl-CoA lyase
MAIHPSQIAALNTAFQPDASEIAQARRVLAAMETARQEGRAAVALDGKLLDIASIRQAQAWSPRRNLLPGKGWRRYPARRAPRSLHPPAKGQRPLGTLKS